MRPSQRPKKIKDAQCTEVVKPKGKGRTTDSTQEDRLKGATKTVVDANDVCAESEQAEVGSLGVFPCVNSTPLTLEEFTSV